MSNEQPVAESKPVYADEHAEILRIVDEYKQSSEYQAAYEQFKMEDPAHLRQMEYEKVREVVREFKAKQNSNISEKEIIEEYLRKEIGRR